MSPRRNQVKKYLFFYEHKWLAPNCTVKTTHSQFNNSSRMLLGRGSSASCVGNGCIFYTIFLYCASPYDEKMQDNFLGTKAHYSSFILNMRSNATQCTLTQKCATIVHISMCVGGLHLRPSMIFQLNINLQENK